MEGDNDLMPEKVKCLLCGSDDYIILSTKGQFDTDVTNVICKHCGLIYINPRMPQEWYERFYQCDYIFRKKQTQNPDFRKMLERQIQKAEIVAQLVNGLIGPAPHVLDIGCGVGGYALYFQKRYQSVVLGIEPAKPMADFAKGQGIEVFCGSFDDFCKENDKSFDFIIMSHVLEHFLDPINALLKIQEILTNDGFMYVEIPNILKTMKRIEDFLQIEHPYNFTPHTINVLFTKTGFKIVRLSYAHNTGAMRLVVCKDVNSAVNSVSDKLLMAGGSYDQVLRAIRVNRLKRKLGVVGGMVKKSIKGIMFVVLGDKCANDLLALGRRYLKKQEHWI